MRVLIVGSGGREHALAWKLAQSEHVTAVHGAPGNPGFDRIPTGGRVAGKPIDVASDYDFVVIGPEAPLAEGLSDELRQRGSKVFGPTKAAAEIEASKVFCRELARRHDVPMAEGESFNDPDAAADYAKTLGAPLVVKAEGLAAGKGVLICRSHDDARAAIDRIMREGAFGASGSRVVVEEFLEGREISMLCLTDGERKLFLEPAQDYKRARDGGEGLNTGGMGAYSPVPWFDDETRTRAMREIAEPLIDGLAAEGRAFSGCFYAGLMVTAKGPRLIEVNARFGDPEIEALVLRMKSDLLEPLVACADGALGSQRLEWTDEASVSVVVASGGYPDAYETGTPIDGIEAAESAGAVVFHAGTDTKDGALVSAGGRVLNVAALGSDLADARARVYNATEKIQMHRAYYRSDIARDV